MSYCKNCGTKLDDQDAFCSRCGCDTGAYHDPEVNHATNAHVRIKRQCLKQSLPDSCTVNLPTPAHFSGFRCWFVRKRKMRDIVLIKAYGF